MDEPKDHHFVPQFYLAGWCNSNGKLKVYSRPHNRVVTSELKPRSTGYETGLYTYTNVPDGRQQAIEKQFMRRIDNAAASALRKLLAGSLGTIGSDERSDFTRFVLSLRARHAGAIALAHKQGREVLLAKLAEKPEEFLAAQTDPTTSIFPESVEKHQPHVISNFGLLTVPSVIADDEVGKRLWGMAWWTHELSIARADLLTSDRPCVLEGDALKGLCIIALPLGPRMALFISNDHTRVQLIRSLHADVVVEMVNRDIITCADRYLYGTGPHHLALIEAAWKKHAA